MGFDYGKFAPEGSDYYVKFQSVGDAIEGELLSVTEGTDFNGNPVPVLEIETDEGERAVTAGPVVLRQVLADVQPQPGQEIRIEFTGYGQSQPGRNPAKLFEVTVL